MDDYCCCDYCGRLAGHLRRNLCFGECLRRGSIFKRISICMRYVYVYVCGYGLGDGNGSRRMFTFKPLIPPLISSAAFSPWAPVGLLVVVVGVDMVVIKVGT